MVDIIVDMNFFIKLILEIYIFDMQPSKNADGTKFKGLCTWRLIAINSDTPCQKYLSRAQDKCEEYVVNSGIRN